MTDKLDRPHPLNMTVVPGCEEDRGWPVRVFTPYGLDFTAYWQSQAEAQTFAVAIRECETIQEFLSWVARAPLVKTPMF
jgi:hypothetical protein